MPPLPRTCPTHVLPAIQRKGAYRSLPPEVCFGSRLCENAELPSSMCLLREFWTTYRMSELQNCIYAPRFEQILISLRRTIVFSHSLGRKLTPRASQLAVNFTGTARGGSGSSRATSWRLRTCKFPTSCESNHDVSANFGSAQRCDEHAKNIVVNLIFTSWIRPKADESIYQHGRPNNFYQAGWWWTLGSNEGFAEQHPNVRKPV